MRVLGIETSCDETAAALYDSERGLLAHAVHSQVDLHAAFGGVVPELASRDHVRRLIPIVRHVLGQAGAGRGDVEGVAYTAGPGLIGALLVGAAVARSLAWTWSVPSVAVHNMEAHLLAPMLEPSPPAFPLRRPAGVRGAHAARRGPRSRPLPHARGVPRRRRRGGLRPASRMYCGD